MKLQLWLYQHKFGCDIVRVLCPDGMEPTLREVVEAAKLSWDGALLDDDDDRQPFEVNEEETLQHSIDLPLPAGPLPPGLLAACALIDCPVQHL